MQRRDSDAEAETGDQMAKKGGHLDCPALKTQVLQLLVLLSGQVPAELFIGFYEILLIAKNKQSFRFS